MPDPEQNLSTNSGTESPSTGGAESAPSTPSSAPEAGASIKDIMSFDPFGPDSPTETPAGQGTGQEQPPAQQPPVTQPPQQPAPFSVTPEQWQANERELAELRAMVARNSQPQQQQQPQAPTAKPPRYNVGFTPELTAAMQHEDPNVRIQATSHMVNSALEMVHNRVMEEVQQHIQQLQSDIPNVAQTSARTVAEANAVFSDFYGKYPALNDPAFMPMVMQVSAAVAKRLNANGWSAELRDAIGAEIYGKLKWQLPTQTQRPRPPAQTSASARPGVPVPGNEQADQMMDLLH